MAFEAKARAAKTEERRALWLALESAHLHKFAVHAPNKMPTLAQLTGETRPVQTGADRRAIMKSLAVKTGGGVKQRGPA